MRTIRASEIGVFLYCQRAWWLQQQGFKPLNSIELAAGEELHRRHGLRVLRAGCLQAAAVILLVAALVLSVVQALSQLL